VGYLIITLLQIVHKVLVKEFLKSVNIWRRYGQKFGGTVLWLTMYTMSCIYSNQTHRHSGVFRISERGGGSCISVATQLRLPRESPSGMGELMKKGGEERWRKREDC